MHGLMGGGWKRGATTVDAKDPGGETPGVSAKTYRRATPPRQSSTLHSSERSPPPRPVNTAADRFPPPATRPPGDVLQPGPAGQGPTGRTAQPAGRPPGIPSTDVT